MDAGSSKPNERSVVTSVRPCPARTPLVPMETSWPTAMQSSRAIKHSQVIDQTINQTSQSSSRPSQQSSQQSIH
eukprot:1291374-Prymnesium_polylepis.1